MRIIAVRGLNIASLGGEFSVDFTTPVLNDAGLFAITGPTGSGKSTLLDVICLALYSDTPRLKSASAGRHVDLENRTPQDPSNLLRKGCGACSAEVEFEGVDHQIYRARFYCYRAHQNPNGKLQPIERTLYNLSKDGEQIVLNKKEMQAKINSLVGLTFEQFTRAVLLAQNDFATFLKANDTEKSELLEKLTGAEIYTRISASIFRKTTEANQLYKDLENTVAGYPVLNDEELTAVQDKETQAKQTIDQLNQQIQRLREGLRWLETYTQLQADLDRSKEDELHILRQLADNRERQLRLSRIDATQPVKPLWIKLTTLNANAHMLTNEEQTKQTALQLLADQSLTNASQLRQAEEERTRLRQLNEALQPQLKEARSLDNQLLFVRNEYTRLETALKERDQQISLIGQKQQTLHNEIQTLLISQSRINTWIDQHKAFENMMPAVPGLLIQLQTYAKGKAEIDPVRSESERLTTESAKLEANSVELKQQLEASLAQTENLRKDLTAKQSELLQLNPQALRTQSEELAAQLRALTEWADYNTRQHECTEKLRTNTALLHDTSLRFQEAETKLSALTQQLSDLEARLEEAEKAHRLTLSMANHSVETLRGNLEKEKPCPVCGALDHPFSDHDTVTRIVGELEKRYQDVLAQTQSTRQALTAQTAAVDAFRQSLTKLTTEKDFLTGQAQENQKHILQLTGSYPLLAGLTTDRYESLHTQMLAQSEALRQKQTEADRMESALNQLRKELETKEANVREQQKQYDQLRNQAEATKQQASEKTMRYQTLKESLKERYIELRDQLNPYYKEDQWSHVPQEFALTLTDLHKQWKQQTELRDQLTRQKEELEANLALRAKEREGFEREKAETAKQLQDHSLQLADLQTKRSAFFQGDPADEVEAKSAKELNAVSTRHESLAARKLEFDKTRVALETEIKNIKQQIQQTTTDSERTKQSIREWLADYALQHTPLMWDDLETLFALSDEVIASDRNALQLLRDKEIATQTRLASLQKAIENHRTLPAQIEGADATQLTQDLQDTEAKSKAEQQQLMELQLTLRNHSLNLTKRAHIATQIETARQTAGEWDQLNAVFGAQTGDKFRRLAMSFTLDLLLSHANHYLQLINDRYQLVRSTDSLQLNVIDTYMAHEVRNVASLSGGETFIVSLALALGLSSLASNKLHIETLFIDEGFGSLDSETLQMAMSALAALQDMGRKVGVISHVPEMNEQIYPQIRITPVNNGLSKISIIAY